MVFLLNTSFSEQENISQAIRYCLPSLQFFTGANVGSMSWCTFQIFHGNEKIVQLSTANFQLKNLDFHQERILSCFHWTLSWSIFCNQESIVWSTRSPFSNFTINNCFFQIPAQSVYEVLIKLIQDDNLFFDLVVVRFCLISCSRHREYVTAEAL